MIVKIQHPIEKVDYPCIKIYKKKDIIVLFTGLGMGVCLYAGSSSRTFPGSFDNSWEEDFFVPFTGIITLQNN